MYMLCEHTMFCPQTLMMVIVTASQLVNQTNNIGSTVDILSLDCEVFNI